MTNEQAARHNDAFPFTVAPCDDCKSFPVRSFAALDQAQAYASEQRRPYVVALPSGAVVEVG